LHRATYRPPTPVTAAIFWLKNRDPQHWRDSRQLDDIVASAPGKSMTS
jgi:hypothetical protein